MESTLIVRPSSLGDIIHALPIVHDLLRARAGIAIDWIAEEPFAALVGLNRGVRRVIPVSLRRWRHRLFRSATWRELAAFRGQLRAERYDAVIDLQEQVKGALIAWLARGPVHGPDRASIREAVATLAYRYTYPIDPQQHLIDRCRQLAGAAFGYRPEGPPSFDLVLPTAREVVPTRYAVFLHATSRPDKLWPESHWRALAAHFTGVGVDVLLPWGDAAEAQRSQRLAQGLPGVGVPAYRDLPGLAGLLADAELVCGVDTGLVHLAAALGTPTVSLFVATDPRLAGVERAGLRGRDLGGIGVIPPPEQVIAAATELARIANDRQ